MGSSLGPDVVIAGGGIIGASIAWRLGQAGLRVVLCDAAELGREASFAGAGMLAPGGEFGRRSAWSDLAWQSLRLYPTFVMDLVSDSGIGIDYRACGTVEIACDEQEASELLNRAASQSELGFPAHPIRNSQVSELVPHLRVAAHAALFYPEDALVDPRDVMKALAIACRRHGVEVREHCRVQALEINHRDVNVRTTEGSLTARMAVMSAGAWTAEISVSQDGVACSIPKSLPVKGHLLGFSLKPGSLGPILRYGHTYVLQRTSGFTIAGSSEERVGYDRRVVPRIVDDLKTRVRGLLPQLLSAEPSAAWIGFRPATESLDPVVGRLGSSNIWLAYGHYRNGILMAPGTCERICKEITASSGMDWS